MININIKLVLTILFCTALLSCSNEQEKPEKGSDAYQQAMGDFYISLAAMQADEAMFAVEKMDSLSKEYPQEAAIWANLAVFSMRMGNMEQAGKQIQKALDRADNNAEILFLAGILESRRGEVNQSITYLREAAEANPDNVKIAYALAEELQRQDQAANSEEVFSVLDTILKKQPDNLAVLLEVVRTAIKWENRDALEQAIADLAQRAEQWPEEVQRQFQDIRKTILNDSSSNLTFQLAFLRNNLNQLPRFQSDLAAVQIPPTQVGFLVTNFSWLPQPSTAAAPADTALAFEISDNQPISSVELVKAIALTDSAASDEISIRNGEAVVNKKNTMPFPGFPASIHSLQPIDYNYDFINDLAFAGDQGFKLYNNDGQYGFEDVTAKTGLPEGIVSQSYYGLWSHDIDLDGDLDLVMGPREGAAFVLRNNGDGTFEKWDVFDEVDQPVNFSWADFDYDGDSDAAFVTKSGNIQLILNERSSKFEPLNEFPFQSGVKDIETSDINNDGDFELLVWNDQGIHQLYYDHSDAGWKTEKIVSLPASYANSNPASASLLSYDLDNNGAKDIIISTPGESGYWLNDKDLNIIPTFRKLPPNIQDISVYQDDQRLDIISLDEQGVAQYHLNKGSKDYAARIIRPRASGTVGDQRINSFGIDGSVESRSGLLYQKQLIKKSWVHVGLGMYNEAELLRIIWPNGSSQAEFAEIGYDDKIINEQILKGSCPWVFTYNGEKMEFVTDFLWRTGVGIRINAQGDADVIHSMDWIKVSGRQLKPRNGMYDVRITADLWETHFFDYASLNVIDHPEDTHVFVDERFNIPPRAPTLHVVDQLRPVAGAVDQGGRDVTDKIAELDQEFVDSFKLTKYQGAAEEHYIEVNLGDQVPTDKQLRLIASGWVYPTDTSVNIALSQGSQQAPHPLRLEVPNGQGGWKVVRENIGFPAGKSKTMLINAKDIFEPGTDHRVRLVTSMEIYWNRMQWAVEQPDSLLQKKEVSFSKAELRYRGYSEVERPSRFIPERPDYSQISGTTPMWYDLEGFYTRFGKVNALLDQSDDRYVIMNAGDELLLEFPAADEPEEGMTRDFVLVGDGWVKDGDYNTGYSKTVLPLPYHGMEDYSEAPNRLQDDPVYQKHKSDWVNYHTRYITPRGFRSALNFEK